MNRLVLALMLADVPMTAHSGAMEQALAKLDPEERSHQACIIKGLDVVRREARLRTADRMKTSIFGRDMLTGTSLTARGGAVRARGHWYALSLTCELTADLMKATAFTFTLKNEIPRDTWDDLGLWQ